MITWEIKILPIDVPNRIVSITATRIDDTTIPPATCTVSMQSADISTQVKKTEAIDILWSKYLKKTARQILIDELIGNLETIAKINLEGRKDNVT